MRDEKDKSASEVDASRVISDQSGKDDRAGEPARPKEIGGPAGPEPTRYGDWERNGRCSDF